MAVRAALSCLVALLASACAHGLDHPRYVPQPQDALVEVSAPAPPGRVEVVPPRPDSTAVWVDGEWEWRRARWDWVSGRWVEPPAGAGFSPWVFVRGADGRLWYAPGVWRDARGAPLAAAPPPVASASLDSVEVVNASGGTEATGRARARTARPAGDAQP